LLAPGEEKFILGAIELSNVIVRDIMVPRPDVHAVAVGASLSEVSQLFARTQRSRLVVYEGALDHIIGFVHIKDFLGVLLERDRRTEQGRSALPFDLRRIVREAVIVPETKSASELVTELRARGTGIALVVDEFGSILGIVTLEDAVEQVVGEIHDEFDLAERPAILSDGSMVFDASLNVRDLEVQYGIELPEDPAYSTVGGFVLAQLGVIPHGGEIFDFGGYRFTVVEMDRLRIARLKIHKLPEPAEAIPALPATAVRRATSSASATPASHAKSSAPARSGK
jgi:CBS domain containing-hemolysin-like protein